MAVDSLAPARGIAVPVLPPGVRGSGVAVAEGIGAWFESEVPAIESWGSLPALVAGSVEAPCGAGVTVCDELFDGAVSVASPGRFVSLR